jgi:hypothetical protein
MFAGSGETPTVSESTRASAAGFAIVIVVNGQAARTWS